MGPLSLPTWDEREEIAPLDVTLLQSKRLADIRKPREEQRPDKADFLGVYDSRVLEERVASTQKEDTSLAKRFSLKKKTKIKAESHEATTASGELPDDFFPDYKIGSHTYLNVLRFPKVQYFVRLKRIFRTTFSPSIALREAYFVNRVSRGQVDVVLGVEVDSSGRLAKLIVLRSSGVLAYDREGLRTVRDSAPFARPPQELLGSSRRLRMSWTFTTYL